METKVIHIKDAPQGWEHDPAFVYIGRPGKGMAGPYGNPIVCGKPCQVCGKVHAEPGETLNCFRTGLMLRMRPGTEWYNKVMWLEGKTLVCFCRPARCHGDVYIEIIEEIHGFNRGTV